MHEIIYKVDTIKRKVIVFVKREELAQRRQERRRARRIEQCCRYGGVAIELCQKGYEKEVIK